MSVSKKLTPRIYISLEEDFFIREFSINTRISTHKPIIYVFPLNTDEPKANLGSTGTSLVRGLSGIGGITKIMIAKYHVSIYIGKAYDWQSIQADVVVLLKACFIEDSTEVEVLSESMDGQILLESPQEIPRDLEVPFPIKLT